MRIVELDGKGRLTLPKEIRDSIDVKGRVMVMNAGDHVILIPLPSDPLQKLHGALNARKSFRELRRGAEVAGEKEVGRAC